MSNNSILARDRLKEEGVIKRWADDLGAAQVPVVSGAYEYVAMYKDLEFGSERNEKEDITTDDCWGGEPFVRHDFKGTFKLYANKSPWAIRLLFDPASVQLNVDIVATAVVAQEIVFDKAVGDGEYIALIPDIDWTNPTVALTLSVKTFDEATQSVVSVPIVLGTDFSLTRYNGYTALKSIPGGAILKGDKASVDYSFFKLIDITMCEGSSKKISTQEFVFCTIVDGVDIETQDKVFKLIVKEAYSVGEYKFSTLDCLGEKDPTPIDIEIRNRKGSEWCMRWDNRV